MTSERINMSPAEIALISILDTKKQIDAMNSYQNMRAG
jgi:hypothetical protein